MAGLEPGSNRVGRTYTWSDETFYSVTTILQALAKPALPRWAAKSVATYATQNLPLIITLCTEGRDDEAMDLLKNSPWRQRDKAADLGTIVHRAVEDYCLDLQTPPTEAPESPFIEAFRQFLAKFQPLILESEVTVFNRRFNYAGTLDLILEMRGERWLVDVKSGSGVYPEYALQVCAYAHGEFIGRRDGTEGQMPSIQRGAVLHLRPNGYHFIPVRIDDDVYKSFLHLREVFRWTESIQDTAIMPEVRT